jgi:phosphatidylserine decarboxylase
MHFVNEQGKFMDSRQSTGSISQWLSDSSLHNNEYVVPLNGYQSFNQFFTRSLKPGMRPVARPNDNSVIVSPVDGIIDWVKIDLKADSTLPVKGRMRLSLNQLLGNSKFADKFIDGTVLSVILLPRNYHHFHSPVSGELVESKEHVGNILFGSQLMDFFMTGKDDFSVFENYKHGYFIIKTKQYGYVAMVPVGLETVGSVVFEHKVKDISTGKEVMISKGEKLGHFAYGGSMVMLLFEKNRMASLTVQQGQQIGIFNQEIK